MKGKRFDTIPTIQKASTEAMEAITAKDFKACFRKINDRLQCRPDTQGDWFE